MEAITSAGDGGCCISNLEWTSHSRPYFGLMFYHFLLPLFCPCVSICGQLQEPPVLFIEIDTPYAELSCQQPFFTSCCEIFFIPLFMLCVFLSTSFASSNMRSWVKHSGLCLLGCCTKPSQPSQEIMHRALPCIFNDS